MSATAVLASWVYWAIGCGGVPLLILLILGLWLMGVYNNLVSLRNRFENAFAQIDVQLKRRYDLIPNLVEVAKGYMKHEKETLEAVIQARNQALTAGNAAAGSISTDFRIEPSEPRVPSRFPTRTARLFGSRTCRRPSPPERLRERCCSE